MRYNYPKTLLAASLLLGVVGCASNRPMVQGHAPKPTARASAPEYQRKLWSVAHWQSGAANAAKELLPNIQGMVLIQYKPDDKRATQEPTEFMRGYRVFLQEALTKQGVQVTDDPRCPNIIRISSRTVWHKGNFDHGAWSPVVGGAILGGLVGHLVDDGHGFWEIVGATAGAVAMMDANPVNYFASIGYGVRHLFTGNGSGTAESTAGETYVVNELVVNGILTRGQVEVMYIPRGDVELYSDGNTGTPIRIEK